MSEEFERLKAENERMKEQIQRSYQKGCCLCSGRIEELEGSLKQLCNAADKFIVVVCEHVSGRDFIEKVNELAHEINNADKARLNEKGQR